MDQQAMIDDLVRCWMPVRRKAWAILTWLLTLPAPAAGRYRPDARNALAAPLACSVPTLHEGLDRTENE